MSKKVVIVGGVAGGATAAARLRRLDENAEIVLLEKDGYISFANCGLPYYIGGAIEKRDNLLVQTSKGMRDRYNIDVRVRNEAIRINRDEKTIDVLNRDSGEQYSLAYDALVLSPGAYAFKPNIPGIEHERIMSLRNMDDTDRIKQFVDKRKPERAVVIGGGYVGLEMAENLHHRGCSVTVVELADHILQPFDPEMAAVATVYLRKKGIAIIAGNGVSAFHHYNDSSKVELADGRLLDADIIIASIGVRPEITLAKEAGLELGSTGGIRVDEYLRTSDPDIYALGDAAEDINLVSSKPALIPLAGPANKQGRIVANNIAGKLEQYKGSIGTSIVKLFDMAAASSGLNERSLRAEEIPFASTIVHPISHSGYYPGSTTMSVKILFDPEAGTMLGAQVIGFDGVDKTIDVLAIAIQARMTVFDLQRFEHAYAPPFSSAKSPVNIAGFVAGNIIAHDIEVLSSEELDKVKSDKETILDVRSASERKKFGFIEGSINIPINELRNRIDELPKDATYYTHCWVGLRSYVACRLLTQHGYKCKNISGGFATYRAAREARDT